MPENESFLVLKQIEMTAAEKSPGFIDVKNVYYFL